MRFFDESSGRRAAFISVIMPVRNEEASIGGVLRQLLEQDYDPQYFEILVVDGASADRTRQVVEEIALTHPQVRLLHNPRIWSSAARNVGLLAAQGELLLIVDGHCELPGKHYFSTLVDAFERSGADCLGRPQPLDIADASPLQSAIAVARDSRLGHHPASFIYSSELQFVPAHSVAVAYRREVFDRVGLFDEGFDACEDVELNHRIDLSGMRCLLVPELRVSYHPRATLRGLWRQMDRYGRGRTRLLRKHPGTFSLLGFAPAVFVGLLIVCAVLASWLPTAALGGCLLAAAYLAALVAFSAYLAWTNRSLALIARLPIVFVVLHFAAGVGALREAISGRSTSQVPVPRTAGDMPFSREEGLGALP